MSLLISCRSESIPWSFSTNIDNELLETIDNELKSTNSTQILSRS